MLDTACQVITTAISRITRVGPRDIEVFALSDRSQCAYTEGERTPAGAGLYCEPVMHSRAELLVRDARAMPYWTGNPDMERGMVSYLGMPLLWPDGEVFGSIGVLNTRGRDYSMLDRRLLRQFRLSVESDLALLHATNRLNGEVLRRQRIESSLQKSMMNATTASRHIQLRTEQERSELGRNLHDEVVQGLTAVKMDLASCAALLPGDTRGNVESHLTSIVEMIDYLIARVRRISDLLAPPMLDDLGLASAMEREADECARRTGTACRIDRMDDLAGLDPHASVVLYRAFQRALNYILLAAPTTQLGIEIRRTKSRVLIKLTSDDDRPPQSAEHVDVRDLTEQVRSWGGRLRTWRTPEGQRMLQLSMPSRFTT